MLVELDTPTSLSLSLSYSLFICSSIIYSLAVSSLQYQLQTLLQITERKREEEREREMGREIVSAREEDVMEEILRWSPSSSKLPLLSLNHVSFVCKSVPKSVKFYEEVLGFVLIKRPSSFDFEGAWYQHFFSFSLLFICLFIFS